MSGTTHILADTLLAGFVAEDELESRSPLDCLVCSNEFVNPRRLPCNHSFCQRCIMGRERCPLCDASFDGELPEDSMISFLIDTSHETADVCANCDKISLPMHFCETCQQALCNECKVNTHQAKMFAAHRLVLLEERTRMRGRTMCTTHNEPIILYSLETRQLVCINCFKSASLESRHHFVNLDVAHKIGCEKVEKTAGKLKSLHVEIADQIQLRRRLLNELHESYQLQTSNVNQLCQQMIDTLMMVKERLLIGLRDERDARQQHFDAQLIQLLQTIPFARLYLLASSMFCASASKLDFLETSHDLIKRIQSILAVECIKPIYTSQLSCDVREEYARSLEPFLGLSSLLLTTATHAIGRTSESSCNGSGTASPCRSSRRSGSGYVNYPGTFACSTSKFQLIVDLAGAFGDQFARIDVPLRQYTIEMSNLTKEVQESQRDLTLRRCLINKDRVKMLITRCVDLEGKLGMHSALIQDLHPNLQQIWQEQLDRVRRQQIILREKIENTVNLRESARQLTMIARQLEPFACCLESVALVIDRRRCHPPDPAPMERICHEINTIAPDSQHRIEAIEKEEHNRKLAQEQKKKDESNEFMSAKRQLKTTKEHQRKVTMQQHSNGGVRTVGRDRSRGGTDQAMLSPSKRRNRCRNSDEHISLMDDCESSLDDSFEFSAISETACVEIVTNQVKLYRSQTLRTPKTVTFDTEPLSISCSLPNDDHLTTLSIEQLALTSPSSIDQHQQLQSKSPPKPPNVPLIVFAASSKSMSPGMWEVREKVLESLKQKVPRVDVGATSSPDDT